ncbi:hypothetical protein O1611_g2175 [Lasiodiplodia mahajangana]|uniref:Uncharacterized protein n=1 Tax=Lasiodiplodia mahajangana TaxID=1108764 RepID=A0ACC2JVS5_9PEZI|nr:hypothetical protein O1611_g2175 [Lasiodiplodia mahajangana]
MRIFSDDHNGPHCKGATVNLDQMVADSEKEREPSKEASLGANSKSISVYQGPVDNRGVSAAVVIGNIYTSAQNGVSIHGTSTTNNYTPTLNHHNPDRSN